MEVKIEFEDYKIQYPKAVVFQFEACNPVIEKSWIFSLAGFLIRLEQTGDKTFGFMDEVSFWYDPEVSEKKLSQRKKLNRSNLIKLFQSKQSLLKKKFFAKNFWRIQKSRLIINEFSR